MDQTHSIGLVIYGLSYTVFLTNDTLPGSGEGNRIAIAAAEDGSLIRRRVRLLCASTPGI